MLRRAIVTGFLGCAGVLGFFPRAEAAQPLTYRHRHFLFTLAPGSFAGWRGPQEVWTYRGRPIDPLPEWLVDGDVLPPLPAGVARTQRAGWNRQAIRRTLEERIASMLRRPAGSVTIGRSLTGTGAVTFDGVGLTGRELDLDAATDLTIAALERSVTDIVLPVIETQPDIVVTDPELAASGIKEVVTIGESDFSNSPANRRHNIAVGLRRFNGAIVPEGSVFSFNNILGPVDGSTGYKKELIIKGDRTVPDYGGGLCQVGTTAYRGVWEYGFPIIARKNHSYTVSHYFPQGTDATIFPGAVDLQFRNDSPGAILIQTHFEGDLASFIYYGTRDARVAEIVGPYIWDRIAPPPDRQEPTTEIPPGTTKKLNERIPGLKALWVRITRTATGAELVEPVYSAYEARPLFHQVGVERLPETTDANTQREPTLEEINQPFPPRVF